MKISDNLTQKQLLEILQIAYKNGHENEKVQTVQFIEEIKNYVLMAMNKKI